MCSCDWGSGCYKHSVICRSGSCHRCQNACSRRGLLWPADDIRYWSCLQDKQSFSTNFAKVVEQFVNRCISIHDVGYVYIEH